MFNWFTKWFDRKCAESWNRAREAHIYEKNHVTEMKVAIAGGAQLAGRTLERDPTMNFRLHKAENGWIVEMTQTDRKTDRYISKVHLIPDSEDFDKSLCQIITLEALRG